MSVSYNKLSSIQIGGTYVNYVPIGARGNVSLDCSGNSLFRGATFMDASLNVSGIFNVGGDVSMNSKLFVGGDVSMNSKLRVAGDVSMNSKLFVGGDVSFNQNLYTIGKTSTKNLTINDAYPTPIKTAQIGFDVAFPITTELPTGTTSNVASGTAFKPISIVIPAGNASNVIYVELPLNLFGSVASGVGTGTLTLTYTSVSMNIYKNGSLQSATGQSISPVDFTGGSTKQAFFNGTGGGYPLYLGYYFGYFNIQFPITQFNTSADTYEIELTITASASSGFTLSIASSGGSMGFGIVSPVIPFTETRVKSSTMTYISASTTPFNALFIETQYSYGLKMASNTDFLISAIGEMNLKTNQSLNLTAKVGTASITSEEGSFEFNAPNGFFTANSAENFYLKTTGTDSQILFGNTATDWTSLNSNSTQFNINTYSKPFYINSNSLTQTITGDFETDATGDINLTATDVLITTTGTSVGEFVVRANTNVDIATTTGNIELFANTTMLLKSGGTNTLQVDGNNKMVTSATTTTINNTNHVINAGTTINGDTSINVDNTFNMMPTATIIQNVSATVPAGFLYCNGQAVNRTGTYARLFAAIGTTFGVGNGSTTFNVPNFKGAFLRGREDQTVSGTTYTSAALGTAQQDAVLTPLTASNQGYYNLSSGSARQCVARTIQTGDPVDTGTGILPRFDRTAGENRPFNYAVFYYIRF